MQTYDPHKNTVEVRQANRRKVNLRVLVLSTIGVAVLFAVIFVIYTTLQPSQV